MTKACLVIVILQIVAGCATMAAHRPARVEPVPALDARNPIAMARLYESVFESASPTRLEQWAEDDDAKVAIPAAWELARRTAPMAASAHPDRAVLTRFLAVVDRSTGGAAPAWRDAVLAAGSNDPHNIWFDAFALPMPPVDSLPQVNSVSAKLDGDQMSVTAARVYHWNLPHQRSWYDHSAVLLTAGRAYVAFYVSWPAEPYAVYAVAPDSGKILWSTRIWAENGFIHAIGGAGSGAVELALRGRVLTVFGVSTSAAYIERFDAYTGTNLSRFCTKYFDRDFDGLMTRDGWYGWEMALKKGLADE